MLKSLPAALLLLGILGCGGNWRSDLTKADYGRTPSAPDRPKEDLAAGARQEYPLPILAYYRHHLPPGRNKAALIDLHIQLADKHFDSHIGGSRTRLCKPREVSAEAILAAEIRFNAAPEGAALQAGPIRIQDHARAYPYRDGEAYVVFSGPRLGGGVLDRAFGAQEIAFLETAFLPQIAALRGGAGKGPSLPQGVALDHLDRKPAVLRVRRFLKVIGREQLEGGTRLQDCKDFRAEDHLVLLPGPMDITFTAMAARSVRGQAAYTREDLEAMVETATRAFLDTLAALHADQKPLVIHTGPWGVAEGGHSPAVAWAVQRVAIEVAWELFAQTAGANTQVQYEYEAGDPAGLKAAEEARRRFTAEFGNHLTARDLIGKIRSAGDQDPAWRPGN